MELSSNCTIFLAGRKGEAPSASEIQKKLESPKENVKIQGMQELITAVLQGDRLDKLLVTAIRFCVPCSNSHVKKLTFLFLELVDKCDAQGRLKEEIILVCNALRNDLTSPNEYVRGSALRLAAKIRQAKIIEPLVEAIVKNLEHSAVCCCFRNAASLLYGETERPTVTATCVGMRCSASLLLCGTSGLTSFQMQQNKWINSSSWSAAFAAAAAAALAAAAAAALDAAAAAAAALVGAAAPAGTAFFIVAAASIRSAAAAAAITRRCMDTAALAAAAAAAAVAAAAAAQTASKGNLAAAVPAAAAASAAAAAAAVDSAPADVPTAAAAAASLLFAAVSFAASARVVLLSFCLLLVVAPALLLLLAVDSAAAVESALLRLTISLLPSAPPSVAYEGACCVLSLGSSPVGLRAACGALCQLLLQQTEHNIKLIVLDRLSECVGKAKPGSLSDFVVDLMRGLQTNSLEVRRRILDLVRRLVSEETAGQVIGFLKRQLNKVEEEEAQGIPGSARYRSLLVDALSACCCLHPSVVPLCLGCLGDFLADADAAVASSAALLLRRLAAKEKILRQSIVGHVLDSIRDARHSGSIAAPSCCFCFAAAAAAGLCGTRLLLLLLQQNVLFRPQVAAMILLLLFAAALAAAAAAAAAALAAANEESP
ncbi:hypothetical protein Emag_007631 [Eimeria magna]